MVLKLLSDAPDFSVLDDIAAWHAMREEARQFGLGPFAAFVARPHLPPSEREWCDRILTRSWQRHNENLLELDRVLGLLEHDHIQTVSLKGPLLAQRFYKPPFLRRASTDVDLGIRGNDLQRSCRVLENAGYTLAVPASEAAARSHHATLYHPEFSKVELHIRLSHGPFGIPMETFFHRAVPCRLPTGREVMQLENSDQLLHLILHGGCGLATVFHLFELRRVWGMSPAADRASAISKAERCRFAGVFAMADVACRARLGEPLFLPDDPPLKRTWLHAGIGEDLFREFERHADPARTVNLRTRIHKRWLDLRITDRPTDAARMLLRLARSAWLFLLRRRWRSDSSNPHDA